MENAVGRIRPLAGTLMHFLSDQVGVEFSTNSPWWSWAFRHACFLLNRFSPTRGATAYELLYNKAYGGTICNFGEPVFGYANVVGKGTAKWRRMVFLVNIPFGKRGQTPMHQLPLRIFSICFQ